MKPDVVSKRAFFICSYLDYFSTYGENVDENRDFFFNFQPRLFGLSPVEDDIDRILPRSMM